MAEKGENPFLIKYIKDMQHLKTLVYVNPPSLPYPIKKLLFKTYLDNRQFYEKEAKEFCPDSFTLEKNLPKIKVPALILWGDKDQVIDISSVPVFEKGLKNHKTVIIKDCGHVPMMERPKETATQYIDFVKGIK
jgi:pimeloyl-ACP methyl ester carboxylesterase